MWNIYNVFVLIITLTQNFCNKFFKYEYLNVSDLFILLIDCVSNYILVSASSVNVFTRVFLYLGFSYF